MVLNDPRVVTWLLNVYAHLRADYDYLLVVVGDTGTGKSMFLLHLLETWYKVVLKDPRFDASYVDRVNTVYSKWLERFRGLGAFEMNGYDEGSTSLDSKDFMTKLSKDISKLFNVFRAKKFFSVIVLPNFFNLNKYFRENRLRGLVYIPRRGQFRLFTKKQINRVNAYFEGKSLKSLDRSPYVLRGRFGDYKGVLRKAYEVQKMAGIDLLLDEVIDSSQVVVKRDLSQLYLGDVKRLRLSGLSLRAIGLKLGISHQAVKNILVPLVESGEVG